MGRGVLGGWSGRVPGGPLAGPPPAVLVALLARAPCARRGQRRPWNPAANVVRLMLLSL